MQPSLITWKAGDKVECIKDCVPWCCRMSAAPMTGQTFTLAGFESTVTGEPGIHVQELSYEPCYSMAVQIGWLSIVDFGQRKSVSWPITHFRKLIEDTEKKVDHVAEMKRMAETMPAPTIAPTKVPEKIDG